MDLKLSKLKDALLVQLQKNDITANNLANSKTIGFKRDRIFFDVLKEKSGETIKVSHNSDLLQGTMNQTQNPLDMAISGNGLFTILKDGEEAYTRDGHFSLDQNGFLKTSSGAYVMGQAGEINLSADGINSGLIKMSESGDIYVNDTLVGKLKIVDIQDSESLVKTSSNVYKVRDASAVKDMVNPIIFQGQLEESNVNPVEEMINLIELQRQFESIQRTVKSLDDTLGIAANKIGSYK